MPSIRKRRGNLMDGEAPHPQGHMRFPCAWVGNAKPDSPATARPITATIRLNRRILVPHSPPQRSAGSIIEAAALNPSKVGCNCGSFRQSGRFRTRSRTIQTRSDRVGSRPCPRKLKGTMPSPPACRSGAASSMPGCPRGNALRTVQTRRADLARDLVGALRAISANCGAFLARASLHAAAARRT